MKRNSVHFCSCCHNSPFPLFPPSKKKRQRLKRERAVMATKNVRSFVSSFHLEILIFWQEVLRIENLIVSSRFETMARRIFVIFKIYIVRMVSLCPSFRSQLLAPLHILLVYFPKIFNTT